MGFVRCSAYAAIVVAVIIGIFVAGIPTQIGFFRWLAHRDPDAPMAVGLAPAFMNPDEYRYTFEEVANTDLSGQTAVVTGANSGVGYWTSLHLARQGASVIMACRTPHKCDAAAARIRSNFSEAAVSTLMIDTSKLKVVRKFAKDCQKLLGDRALDMLFLNAGIPTGGPATEDGLPLSEDGIEMVFATNHVGHHLLYKLLEPTLKASPMARVVLTSSAANYEAPEYGVATDLQTLNNPGTPTSLFGSLKISREYGQSKLAQVLFAQELTRQLPADSNIYVNSFHPGAVDTKIWGKNPFPRPVLWLIEKLQEGFMWTGEDGCLTMLYLGIATDALQAGNVRGQYFHPQAMRVTPNKKFTQDPAFGQAVWKFTESLIQS